MRYDMNLFDPPFESIQNGTKRIELRLNDEKRNRIRPNDRIFFHRYDQEYDVIKTTVSDIRRYRDFRELYEKEDLLLCGYEEGDHPSYEDMYEYYSKEAIEHYGVLAIEIVKSEEPYLVDGHVHLEHGPLTEGYAMKFINEAIRKGLDEIDILDHSHRFKEFRSCYDLLRVYPEQDEWLGRPGKFRDTLNDYFTMIEVIRKKDLPIRVRFGLEVCYTEETEDLLREILKDVKLDFLTGSVHSVGDILYDMSFSKRLLSERYTQEEIIELYYRRLIACASSGLFDRIGHPDQIKVAVETDDLSLKKHYEELARVCKEKHILAENNSGCHWRYGLSDIGNSDTFLKTFKEYGVGMITASDAHDPKDTGNLIREAEERIR